MDAVLENFRRSFGLTTPFFQFLSLDPPAPIEELYRRVDKFSALEDNIRVALQIVMITAQSNKSAAKGASEQKSSQGKSQKRPDGKSEKKKDPPQFTALNIAYDRLLPIIRDLLDFRWPLLMRASPDHHNRSLRCDYHRDHGHETNHCQSLKFMVEKLIRASHLRRYMREPTRGAAAATTAGGAVAEIKHAQGPQLTTNINPRNNREECSGQPRLEPE